MKEWRALHLHRLDTTALTSALSTISTPLMSIITTTPMLTTTESSTEERRPSQDKTRYISGKLVTIEKMSEKKGSRCDEDSRRNYPVNNQNCCTVFLTDSGMLCTKL